MDDKNEKLFFHNPVIKDDGIFVSSILQNGLFRINIDEKKARFQCFFPNELFDAKFIHASSMAYEDKILFAPFAGKKVLIYEKQNKRFCTIGLKHAEAKQKSLFYKIVMNREKAYLIPCRYRYLVVVDMKTMESFEYAIKDCEKSIAILDEKKPFFYKAACIFDEKVLIGSGQNDIIHCFDIKNRVFSLKKVPYNCGGFSNAIVINGQAIFVGKNGSIIGIDHKNKNVSLLHKEKENGKKKYGKYFDLIAFKNGLLMSGTDAQEICYFDISNRKIQKIQINNLDNEERSIEFAFNYSCLFEYRDRIFFQDVRTGKLFELIFGEKNIKEVCEFNMNDINYTDYEKYIEAEIAIAKRMSIKKIHLIDFFNQLIKEDMDGESILYE